MAAWFFMSISHATIDAVIGSLPLMAAQFCFVGYDKENEVFTVAEKSIADGICYVEQ